MTDVDWHAIAKAIRENRFEDVSPEEWSLVADKIDTKRKGRPRGTKQAVIDQAVYFLEEIERGGTKKEIKERIRIRIREKHKNLHKVMKRYEKMWKGTFIPPSWQNH